MKKGKIILSRPTGCSFAVGGAFAFKANRGINNNFVYECVLRFTCQLQNLTTQNQGGSAMPVYQDILISRVEGRGNTVTTPVVH